MARTSDDYLHSLQAALPPGAAWSRDPGATLTAILAAFADGFADADRRAEDLLNESDPRSTVEMLGDWERNFGLPDPCLPIDATIQERRRALVARITRIGGQSREYFIELAANMGYAGVTIDEYRPFICGRNRCGDPLNGGPSVRFNWRVHVPNPTVIYFRAGASQCGDALAKIRRATDLECIFQRLKPAHTHLIFSYEGV